jgi:hypothetical protein
MNCLKNPKRMIPAVARWLALLILIAVMGSTTPLLGVRASEIVNAPQLSPGDRWERSNGRTYEVTGEEGEFYVIRVTRPGRITEELWSKTSLSLIKWREPGKDLRTSVDPPQRTLDFPLEVGKKWNFSYRNLNLGATFQRWNRVEGWEEVRVPAGPFRALKIHSDGRRFDTGYQFAEIYWYAPAVKGLVKAESDVADRRFRESMEFELVRFDLR